VDLARFLTEHGADVTTKGKNGLTPLSQASASGIVELTQILGAALQGRADFVPFSIACGEYSKEVEDFLVKHGLSYHPHPAVYHGIRRRISSWYILALVV